MTVAAFIVSARAFGSSLYAKNYSALPLTCSNIDNVMFRRYLSTGRHGWAAVNSTCIHRQSTPGGGDADGGRGRRKQASDVAVSYRRSWQTFIGGIFRVMAADWCFSACRYTFLYLGTISPPSMAGWVKWAYGLMTPAVASATMPGTINMRATKKVLNSMRMYTASTKR